METPKRTGRDKLADDLAIYLRTVGRKARKGRHDPNDRGHDRELESKLRCMSPLEIDALMYIDAEEGSGQAGAGDEP